MHHIKITPARLAAFNVIKSFESSELHLKDVIEKELSSHNLSSPDKRLATDVAYGVIRWKLYLDSLIRKRFSLSKKVKIILWISLYQLIFLSKVPARAAVDEAVKMSRYYSKEKTSGFVNWFLRDFLRRKEKNDAPGNGNIKMSASSLSVNFSYPLWLVKRWIKQFGVEKAYCICKFGNMVTRISIKVNTLKITPDEFEEILNSENITFGRSDYFEDVFNLKNAGNRILKFIRAGYCYVQDEASVAVGDILCPKEGEMILDMCASPGGKSLHIGNLTENRAFIVSMDRNFNRTKLIKENIERYGVLSAKPIAADAVNSGNIFKIKFDKVLVDAPCSGTGIIRRHPDIKWRRNEKEIKKFAALQLQLLKAGFNAAKQGGIVVYSTCTLENEECEGVVSKFLSQEKSAVILNLRGKTRKPLERFVDEKGFFRTFPSDGMDGFFCAVIEKV